MRCPWAEINDRERAYHDESWGVPVRDDQQLFEMICLEGAQAGLSWDTILARRDNYRRIFKDFDIAACAALSDEYLEGALLDAGIIRNRMKVWSVRSNAQIALRLQAEHGSLNKYLWSFVDHTPIQNAHRTKADVPATTELSDRLSKDMKVQGFKFIGSTICYAFMQAVGMVNDHQIDCDQYEIIKELA